MAYRQPERRDRTHESYAPSYLDEFLETIEPLQASTRSTFAEIAQLDERINTTLDEAQAAVDEVVRRATSKVAIESVRRQYHEFIHLQASAQEFSEKKLALASSAHESIENVIEDLDKRLLEFEAQLRKEGRWPGASPPAVGRNAGKPPVVAAEKVSSALRTTAVTEPSAALPPKLPQKSRRRETIPANPATPRVAALATARAAAGAGTTTATPTVDKTGDTVIEDDKSGEAMKSETVADGEQVATDGTLYCTCRGPSAGEMVACEGKKCKIEWFHFECVGLKEAPKGTWYCPTCTFDRRRKSGGRRK